MRRGHCERNECDDGVRQSVGVAGFGFSGRAVDKLRGGGSANARRAARRCTTEKHAAQQRKAVKGRREGVVGGCEMSGEGDGMRERGEKESEMRGESARMEEEKGGGTGDEVRQGTRPKGDWVYRTGGVVEVCMRVYVS